MTETEMFAAMGNSFEQAKGFHITFPNRVTVSVQFGAMNYCDNKNYSYKEPCKPCANAEVAVWRTDIDGDKKRDVWLREWPYANENDDVQGYLTPTQVLEILNWAASQ